MKETVEWNGELIYQLSTNPKPDRRDPENSLFPTGLVWLHPKRPDFEYRNRYMP
jgi:hypothetical protein